MRKITIAMLSALAAVGVFAVVAAGPAQAGPPTPIGIAEAKTVAKKFLHDYCQSHNCRGSRVKKCESKTQFRVDCDGLYGRGRKDICEFKISVQAVKDRGLRINIIRNSVKCENF